MKIPGRLLSLIITAFFYAITANVTDAQFRVNGTVVGLVDAKTVVVEVSSGRLTVELQYIHVPESGQMLHAVVLEHVRKMLVGKSVELYTKGLGREHATGRLVLNGVDVGRQLLRDGAAWHVPAAMSGQSADEFRQYAESESLARQEKRGVWSIADLKPAWQVRAENENMRREPQSTARASKPVAVAAHQSDTRRASASPSVSNRARMDAWVGVLAGSGKGASGLETYNDPNGSFSVLYTSSVVLDFAAGAQKEKIECTAGFVTWTHYDGTRTSAYLIALRAISSDYRFTKTNTRLTAIIDGRSVPLGSPYSFKGQGMLGGGDIGSAELIFFRTNNAVLESMGNATRVELRINKLSGVLTSEARGLFGQLADATN